MLAVDEVALCAIVVGCAFRAGLSAGRADSFRIVLVEAIWAEHLALLFDLEVRVDAPARLRRADGSHFSGVLAGIACGGAGVANGAELYLACLACGHQWVRIRIVVANTASQAIEQCRAFFAGQLALVACPLVG